MEFIGVSQKAYQKYTAHNPMQENKENMKKSR